MHLFEPRTYTPRNFMEKPSYQEYDQRKKLLIQKAVYQINSEKIDWY